MEEKMGMFDRHEKEDSEHKGTMEDMSMWRAIG